MASAESGLHMPKHKPYPPTTAGLGGQPSTTLDDPICAVFIFLFVLGAGSHMTILQVNLRRKKKFLLSGLLFGFCMARIVTLSLRIALSTHLHNISLAIAAQIFVALGVILLWVINIIFAQRLLRASHPQFAWSKPFSLAFKVYYVCIVAVVIALVTGTIQSFYTRNTNTLRIDRDITRFGVTFFAVTAFLPLPLLLLRALLPKRDTIDKFGTGRIRNKVAILIFTSSILSLGAAFRAGVAYMPRPLNNPAWYHSKACFYTFNFTIEWIVVALYAVIRVDKRFHIPNGAHGAGSYSGNTERKPDVTREVTEEGASNRQEEDMRPKKKIPHRDLEAQDPEQSVVEAPSL